MSSVRVVIVDASAARREALKAILEHTPNLKCAGVLSDLSELQARGAALSPDVILLDDRTMGHGVPLLNSNGTTVPFVRIPTMSDSIAKLLLQASVSAADAVHRIRLNDPAAGAVGYAEVIRRKVRTAVMPLDGQLALDVLPSHSADVILPRRSGTVARGEPVIIVGASTGGTEALRDFLVAIPAQAPAILIAQHMPEMFTPSFAQRLDAQCQITVKEAEAGEAVRRGVAYIAPGHSHLMLAMADGHYVCELSKGDAVNRHRPSVDVLFRSAANVAGRNAIGVIMTGMGRDGAAGMLEMKQAGAYCIAQDEASCVVFGMPKEAIAMGGVDEVLPLRGIAARTLALVGGQLSRQ